MDQLWLWVGFNVFVLAMLAVDLGVFHRQAHDVSIREAARWSAVWIALRPDRSTPASATSAGRRRGWSSSPAT